MTERQMMLMNAKFEQFRDYIKGKKVCVIGIGVSNTPVIDMLLDLGAQVSARDKKPRAEREAFVRTLEEKGVEVVFGEEYLKNICADLIFKAPGIRSDTPELLAAKKNGAVLTNEMEVFFALCPATIFGVTGSDGKTTTTTLISKMLERQYGRVYVGGNIGKPLLPEVASMTEEDYAVVELSSFQLQAMSASPDVAVITNLSPNHLDWHTDMAEYLDAKKNIFRFQTKSERVVLNYENDATRRAAQEAPSQIIFFSSRRTLNESGVYEKDGWICENGKPILKTAEILIPGRHNVENYMAAIGAVSGYVKPEIIREIARTFGGVEHRIELVRELNGVRYYNSSIDSSPTRTEAAMRSFSQKVIVIMGGYDKHIPFAPLACVVSQCAKAVVLTGATADKIYDAIKDTGVPIRRADDLKRAVYEARSLAQEGDVVLLSPACASFDAFANFMERGNKFKEIVREL